MASSALRIIMTDHLSARLPILAEADRQHDTVLMCELMAEATTVNHHVKKLAFQFAAMRHFAEALRTAGFTVRYVALDDPANTQTLDGEILRAVRDLEPASVWVTEPGEWRQHDLLESLQLALPVPLTILPDTRFLCSTQRFSDWVGNKQQLRMEFFYRDMRREHGILLQADGSPEGGQWNFDSENRKPPVKGLTSPPRLSFRKDQITHDVLDLVRRHFPDHYGKLEPFYFSVTRKQALRELDQFITHILPGFGDYQDAMLRGEAYLNHSLLSTYINAGLLYPLEVIRRAEAAYREGQAPLNAAEGFIRQILGWREYVHGIYWHFMPSYRDRNELGAAEPLPWFYWSGETAMACMREALGHTYDHAYSHHIQRLMVTGNFALIAGLDPIAVHEWYLSVYADAYEWVELPNTIGMSLHADGGVMGSKPYAASGNYINRMSNFCAGCRYDPKVTLGDNACPFNALYWDFVARHRDRFGVNRRMPYVYANWDKMDAEKQDAIQLQAASHLQSMRAGTL